MGTDGQTVPLAPGVATLRVGVLAAAGDGAVGSAMAAFLREAGAEVVDGDDSALLDGLVVLLSSDALTDDAWRRAAEHAVADRIVPVRIGKLDDVRVPKRVAPLNWIEWSSENPTAAFGAALAALLTDPARHALSRQLRHEAEAWQRAGRPPDLLIDDRRRARQMLELMSELEADAMAAPSSLTIAFVKASAAVTLRKQRRRLAVRGLVTLVAVAAAAYLIVELPRVHLGARVNHAAIVTAGDEATLSYLPDWSAANAAALLLEGTAAQRTLGRNTLLQALGRPWPLGTADFLDSVTAMTPFAHGTRAAVLQVAEHGSGLTLIDVRRGAVLWTVLLPRRFTAVDVSADEATAVVAGDGVGVVDLRSRRGSLLVDRGDFSSVQLAARGAIVLSTASGRLEVLRTPGRAPTSRAYAAVIDVTSGPRGRATALVATGPGRFAIVDALDGRTLATARTGRRSFEGAIAPDGRRAIVAGPGDQLWTFGAAYAARPTGIALPVAIGALAWASHDRLVVASQSGSGQVVYLPRTEPLGTVCGDVPRVEALQLERDDEQTLACVSGGLKSFWRLPAAPRRRAAGETSARSFASTDVRLETRGAETRIHWRGSLGSGSTDWFSPFGQRISAVAASPSGREIAFGSSEGLVAIVALAYERARVVDVWGVPDAAPVTAAGWDGGPVVSTASGQTWSVPTCGRCATDAGLLATARARFGGCFTERQLQWIDADARRRAGLRLCQPILRLGTG